MNRSISGIAAGLFLSLVVAIGFGGLLLLMKRSRAAATELRQRLTESERQFREFVEGSLQGVLLIDDAGRVLLANPAAAEMFGFRSVDEILAINTMDDLVTPADRARTAQYQREQATGRPSLARCKFRGRRPDGAARRYEMHARRITWEGRQVTLAFLLPTSADEAETPRGASSVGQAEVSANLKGANILLVEDNEINQLVASGILESVGARTTIAANGREAVIALHKQRFDAVLMDLQMPVMDGYAATRAIRQELGLTELPIIAVTAHALTEERRRCFEAGMNEHVSKPVDPQHLVAVLTRFVSVASRSAPMVRAVEPVTIPAADGPLPGIDMADAMRRLGGNRELLGKIYIDFAARYAGAAAEISAFLAEGETIEAERLVHTLKGVAGNVGAQRVFAATKAFENGLQNGEDSTPLIAAIADALAEISAPPTAPASMMPQTAAAAERLGEPDRVALKRLITKLEGLFRARDLDAEECFAALKARCPSGLFGDALGQLEGAVGALDFEAALSSLAILHHLVDATSAGSAL